MGNLLSKFSSVVTSIGLGRAGLGAVLLFAAVKIWKKRAPSNSDLANSDDTKPKKNQKTIKIRFLHFGDPKIFLFAPFQFTLLTFILGKMLNSGARFPLPLPIGNKEYSAYFKEIFLQYRLESSILQRIKKFVEAVINGDAGNVDPLLLGLFANTTLGYGLLQGHIQQLTMPFYFWYALFFQQSDLCDIMQEKKAGEGDAQEEKTEDGNPQDEREGEGNVQEEKTGDGDPQQERDGEGIISCNEDETLVSYLSLAYHTAVLLFVMIFGSIALMRSKDVTSTAAQFQIAIMLTDFSKVDDFFRNSNMKWVSNLLNEFQPAQRILVLKKNVNRKMYKTFEKYCVYVNFAVSAFLTKISPVVCM